MTCQLRFEERNQHRKLKKIASILSNAILQFWSSVEVPGELEKTSMGTEKVFDCQTSFMVLMTMVTIQFFAFLLNQNYAIIYTC